MGKDCILTSLTQVLCLSISVFVLDGDSAASHLDIVWLLKPSPSGSKSKAKAVTSDAKAVLCALEKHRKGLADGSAREPSVSYHIVNYDKSARDLPHEISAWRFVNQPSHHVCY